MTGQIAGPTMLAVDLVVVVIGASMVAGALDVLRLPGWAWRKAEEPKIAYFAIVALLPLVGLAMYAVRARPKVRGIAAAGRAASLPFERFGDGAPPMDSEQVAAAPEPIRLVAVKPDLTAAFASAPATRAPAPAGASSASPGPPGLLTESAGGPEVDEPGAGRGPGPAEEPAREPALVGGDTFFSTHARNRTPAAPPAPAPAPVPPIAAAPESTGAGAATATAAPARPLGLPAGLANRSYNPRQRASLGEDRLTRAVPAGWKADPTGRHQFRYWNGRHWTENVADAGVQNRDAVCA